MFIVALLITQKYIDKRQKATGYLACSIFFWSFTCLMSAIIYYNSFSLADGKIIQTLIYGGTFTGTIFTYMFARKVLITEKTKFYRYYIMLGIIAIIVIGLTDSSDAVPFPDSIDHLAFVLKTEFSLIVVFYSGCQ